MNNQCSYLCFLITDWISDLNPDVPLVVPDKCGFSFMSDNWTLRDEGLNLNGFISCEGSPALSCIAAGLEIILMKTSSHLLRIHCENWRSSFYVEMSRWRMPHPFITTSHFQYAKVSMSKAESYFKRSFPFIVDNFRLTVFLNPSLVFLHVFFAFAPIYRCRKTCLDTVKWPFLKEIWESSLLDR